jgi:6,7-dimethyl-8-ribityllumazine synthase
MVNNMTTNQIAIVVSDTYPEITSKMLDIAREKAEELNTTIQKIEHVPGCFDIPLAVKRLLAKEGIEGIVTLGAIIQGETAHDEIIANSVANALTKLSLQYNKPVTLGVSGPRMTRDQAIDRINKMSSSATKGCIEMIR